MRAIFAILGIMSFVFTSCSSAAPAPRKVVRAGEASVENLLQPDSWVAWEKGFVRDGDSFVCDNGKDAKVQRGAGQTVVLDQKTPLPIAAAAWSRSENVEGGIDNDYSLYLDILYTDGKSLYGQSAPFTNGTHDWERREVIVIPEKPVKSVSCYLLLRGHAGKAWFRGAVMNQMEPSTGAVSFDGKRVEVPKTFDQGLLIRDVESNSDFAPAINGQVHGIKVDSSTSNRAGASFIDVEIRDLTGKDRAVTVVYVLPVGQGQVRWLGSPSNEADCKSPAEYMEANHFNAGANGLLGRYPLGAVSCGGKGVALGLDMEHAAFFRIGYSSGTRELFIAYDIGLTPEKPQAHLRFCSYEFSPEWGFRAALEKYQAVFPDFFKSRTPEQGLWMPFAKISKVKNWEDFGFKFKEGDDETEWDDAHSIATFRYTEPMTWWMPMPKDKPRTLTAALDEAKRLVSVPEKNISSGAKSFFTSGFFDEKGQFIAKFLDTPWCNGAVWSINSMPEIRGDVSDFRNKWNSKLRDQLYASGNKGVLDGEYVDSSEGYVTAELDFRRDHFAAARTPLTFSPGSRKPAIFRGLIAYEYVKAIAGDMHGIKRLIMANGTPDQLCWLAPWLDVMGAETDWNDGEKWQPMPLDDMLYRRALCGPKPYCFLMNTDFDKFSSDMVEKFMKRSLAFGIFPGFFSSDASSGQYFTRPNLYERDRHLFKKYVPLCKRIAEAGWRPVPNARSGNPKVNVERFGENYLTVFNDGAESCEVILTREGALPKSCRELISGRDLKFVQAADKHSATAKLRLGPEDVAVLEFE
ncbi:MAG: hypothetical protein WC637_22835 [Victivallales bacterium]